MTEVVSRLSRQYAAALCRYVAEEKEATLQQAYELGCKANADGLGVFDMARLHQHALVDFFLRRASPAETNTQAIRSTETFFLEALSPFEAAHRGFREANLKLHRVNETLEHRNVELARTNQELELEVNERKRTEKALRESEENLRSLSNEVLHVQEEERTRISRELHDEVGQALTAINMNLAVLKRNGQPDPLGVKKRIADTQSLLEQTMETVHRFARELRPAMLDDLGLLPALRSYANSFGVRTGIRVRFHAAAAAENLDDERKTVVFRVAQESLTNVAKHAQASQVGVSVRKTTRGFRVAIKDNGRSFPVEPQMSGKRKKRLGLLGMQERVRLVDGHLTIQSEPGRGTTVIVEIPFRHE